MGERAERKSGSILADADNQSLFFLGLAAHRLIQIEEYCIRQTWPARAWADGGSQAVETREPIRLGPIRQAGLACAAQGLGPTQPRFQQIIFLLFSKKDYFPVLFL